MVRNEPQALAPGRLETPLTTSSVPQRAPPPRRPAPTLSDSDIITATTEWRWRDAVLNSAVITRQSSLYYSYYHSIVIKSTGRTSQNDLSAL